MPVKGEIPPAEADGYIQMLEGLFLLISVNLLAYYCPGL